MIGKTFTHYRIIKKIGEGGMGKVYLAADTKLDRQVALKFLPKGCTKDSDGRERFEREAKAAAALNHPNIVTIYEINEHEDQTYIAMEYVEGQTLKEMIASGPLPLDRVIEISTQISKGLNAAHKAGIVHRDIKPQNIIINKEGSAKILDFGLAKLKGVSQLTKESSTLGTIHYLSPEQALGKEVDHRSDIWSLGVILYEMITGELPFKGDYEQALIYSILNEEPAIVSQFRPDTPSGLEKILRNTLGKKPDERYQNISDLMVDIEQLDMEQSMKKSKKNLENRPNRFFRKTNVLILSAVSLIVISIILIFTYKNMFKKSVKIFDSVAICPFVNRTKNPDLDYFSEGIASGISHRLSRLPNLHKVISSSSLRIISKKNENARAIAQKVNVKSVVFGDVLLYRNTITLNIELRSGEDNRILWGERYSKPLTSIEEMEILLTREIVDNLGIQLVGDEQKRLNKIYTSNSKSNEMYNRGNYILHSAEHSETGYLLGIEFFEKAIQLDNSYALAYVGLANCYKELSRVFSLPKNIGYVKARDYLKKALEIDKTLGEAHATLGLIKFLSQWDMTSPENYFKQAKELSPGSVDVNYQYSQYLMWTGRAAESIQVAKRAVELDPLSPLMSHWLGVTYFYALNFDESIRILETLIEFDPQFFWAHVYLAHNYSMKGLHKKVIFHADKVLEVAISQKKYLLLSTVGGDYARAGKHKKAQEILDTLLELPEENAVDPLMLAEIYAGLDQKEKAFSYLEKGYDIRSGLMIYLKVYSQTFLKNLSSDPRYTELLKKMGFEK